jgi:hypothetical protein
MIQDVNIAYYKETDWERLLAYADDRETMHDTWKEWHESFLKMKNDLIAHGFKVKDIVVDLDELQRYCIIRGIKNDGKARSSFVTNK